MAKGLPVELLDAPNRLRASPLLQPSEMGFKKPGQLMAFENFEDGPQGWVQLYTQNLTIQAPMAWIKDRHKARIEARTPDLAGVEGMAIRRYSTSLGEGYYMVDWLAAIHEWDAVNPRPANGPKWFEWSLDTAQDDGKRHYFCVLFVRNAQNLTGLPAGQVTDRILIKTYNAGTYTYHDMGAFAWPVNESKCLPVPITMLVNMTTGKYHGLRIGRWIKKGFFANRSNTELTALPPASGPNLSRFASGFNSLFSVNNLDGSGLSEGVSELLTHRITYFGESI